MLPMAKRLYKHKILLDENFPVRSHLPLLNSTFTVKHIAKDLKHNGWTDDQVYQFAEKNEMIIVTFNVKDFVGLLVVAHGTGVVGVSHSLTNENIDKKLTALFTRSTKRSLFGKVTHITGETEF